MTKCMQVLVFDIKTGEVVARYNGHTDVPRDTATHGGWLASVGYDAKLFIHALPTTE